MMTRYSFSWSMTALLLLAGIAIFTAAEGGPTNLDCRRFVFAPACRGATIKRSGSYLPSQQMIGSTSQDGSGELLIKYPQQQVMDADAQPILMWVDRRLLKVRWPLTNNGRQIQTDTEE